MTDYAAKVAFFLLEKTGSVCGKWSGRMNAKEQKNLFGKFFGKGLLLINGANESIRMRVKVCFGTDFEDKVNIKWNQLN
jgi:hypothetical protein